MTKGQIAGCLGLSVRKLNELARSGRLELDAINRESHRVRLDTLDPTTRRAFE